MDKEIFIQKINEYEEATILEDKQITDLAKTWKVPNDLMNTLVNHLIDAATEEPNISKELTRLDKMTYMCEEAYKMGILTALYMLNECNKEALKQFKAEL